MVLEPVTEPLGRRPSAIPLPTASTGRRGAPCSVNYARSQTVTIESAFWDQTKKSHSFPLRLAQYLSYASSSRSRPVPDLATAPCQPDLGQGYHPRADRARSAVDPVDNKKRIDLLVRCRFKNQDCDGSKHLWLHEAGAAGARSVGRYPASWGMEPGQNRPE